MRRFEGFENKNTDFWAVVRYVSELLGYSVNGLIKEYSISEIEKALKINDLSFDSSQIESVKNYLDLRANVLNNSVEKMLMDVNDAKTEFEHLFTFYKEMGYHCKLPLNKQKGEMKQIAFFTAIINILTEKAIKESGLIDKGFDDDPRGLVYVLDTKRALVGSTSRRYDGVFPSIINPKIVWEIKEYYYATTFGSRVADGVYETQLDGYEFQSIEQSTGIHIEHVYFIDAYNTWWVKGKSYLCRIIDALNIGLVDEVIFGREVFSRWPELIKEYLV